LGDTRERAKTFERRCERPAAVAAHRSSLRRGYITFSSTQELVIVPEVRDKLLDAWGIDAGVRVGEFTREQNAFLDYHRAKVFKHELLG
jgi:hypothetical protein